MIYPARNHHPQANQLVREHLRWRQARLDEHARDAAAQPANVSGFTDSDLASLLPTTDHADWPTTRKFARSAHGADAAWTDSPEYANPIDPPPPRMPLFDLALFAVAIVAVLAWVALLLAERLKGMY